MTSSAQDGWNNCNQMNPNTPVAVGWCWPPTKSHSLLVYHRWVPLQHLSWHQSSKTLQCGRNKLAQECNSSQLKGLGQQLWHLELDAAVGSQICSSGPRECLARTLGSISKDCSSATNANQVTKRCKSPFCQNQQQNQLDWFSNSFSGTTADTMC